MQAPKNGFFYVLDAKTGELISAKKFTDISWATHVDMKTGRPVETPDARFYKTGKPFRLAAEPQWRAHLAPDVVQSPRPASSTFRCTRQNYTFTHDATFTPSPLTTNLGIRRAAALADPARAGGGDCRPRWPASAAGSSRGIPIRQREVWRAEREGAANGGVLSTAGGLVFQGTGTGEFMALDARSGTQLWSAQTQTGVIAAPISYMVGRHAVCRRSWSARAGRGRCPARRANAKGNTLPNISRLLVYALGGAAKLPPAEPRPVRTLAPPPATAPAGDGRARRGRVPDATADDVTGRRAPRTSAFFRICATARRSIRARHGPPSSSEGVMKANGMASFAAVLDASEAEAIRAYVIAQANAAQQGSN